MKFFFTLLLFQLTIISITAQDGALDLTFNNSNGAHNRVYNTIVRNDGKILISGEFPNVNNSTTILYRIALLNEDGTIDPSFNPTNNASSSIESMALQNDGKILIGGHFPINGTTSSGVKRLNADGSLDYSFGVGDIINNSALSIALQSDSKIIIGGYFTANNGVGKNRVARLLEDGNIDNTFNVGTGANGTVYTVQVQSDGKVIVAGEFTQFNGVAKNRIVRLNSNGSIDDTFNYGTGPNNHILSCHIQPNGKILLGGSFGTFSGLNRNGIVRLNSDGSVDSNFTIGVGAQKNDTSFAQIYSIKTQNDGKILLGGIFDTFNNVTRKCIARLQVNGTLDNTFTAPIGPVRILGGFNELGIIRSISLQNGKIIIGGDFTKYNNVARGHFARLANPSQLSTTDFNYNTAIELYPNPSTDKITFNKEVKEVIIFDLNGRKANTKLVNNEINIASLASGTYAVQVTTLEGTTFTEKIIKK